MTEQLKLVLDYDNVSEGTSLDLLDSTLGGFCLRNNGWTPAPSGNDGKNVFETLALRAIGDSATQDSLATPVQALAAQIEAMKNYKSNRLNHALFLRVQGKNETEARQAFIYSIRDGAGSTYAHPIYRNQARIIDYLLTIERGAYWEDTNISSYATGGTSISVIGGVWNYGASKAVSGDVAARLSLLTISAPTSGGGYNQVWVGFRTGKYGTLANFQSTWSLRKGAFGTDTTGGTSHVDATAKDGYRAQCTFGTDTTLVRRVTIECQDVTTNYEDQRGEYQVLLRCKLSAAGEVRVRMAEAYSSNTAYKTHYRQSTTSTSWVLIPMGKVKLPPTGILPAGTTPARYYSIGIDAERVSGSPTLYLDCLVMIPIAEGSAYISGADISFTTGHSTSIHQSPDGEVFGTVVSTAVPITSCNAEINEGVPVGDGSLVLACTGTADDVNHEFGIAMYTIERWKDLRGTET